ncbi:class I SAM-dependent methyltransferase [Umezawaea endophytica]|uniref:Class I SAM-dependent methyltransferase n=1 Tax=Umezawaea endophytica TaxID=1654476 RepID=A0A9X2VGU3_9PSEU|nr:class I SAM-dependent methyltransferase [Umezawaea endophytica]MCS7476321.1 class I SAM-dependent methyltransferase [Umezawaea endophytica]
MTTDRAYLPAMGKSSLLPFYDVFSTLFGAKDAQWQLVAQASLPPGGTVLEIGCGTGNVLVLAGRVAPGATLIGLDPDADALAVAGRKTARAGLAVRFDRGYADRLPYDDGSVDRVLSSFMFHHLPGEQKLDALREVHRVLAPGGSLHLLDFDHQEPAPVHRLLRPKRGHGHGHSPGGVAQALMTEAGLRDAVEVSRGTSFLGGFAHYRASR